MIRAVIGHELSDDSHFLGGVHGVLRTWTVEVGLTKSVRIVVAAILVTDTIVSISFVVIATIFSRATGLALDLTGVRGDLGGLFVSFPDIHFGTATTVLAFPGVWISWRWVPA
jgi:hypothetical protein